MPRASCLARTDGDELLHVLKSASGVDFWSGLGCRCRRLLCGNGRRRRSYSGGSGFVRLGYLRFGVWFRASNAREQAKQTGEKEAGGHVTVIVIRTRSDSCPRRRVPSLTGLGIWVGTYPGFRFAPPGAKTSSALRAGRQRF